MSWTLCTSGSAIIKAGANANATIINWNAASQVALNKMSDEAEGSICAELHTDFVTTPSTITQIQNALADICSSKIAMKICAYDTTGYLSREVDTILNVNDDIITKGINKLRDKKFQRFST